jgi:hypothetical protein
MKAIEKGKVVSALSAILLVLVRISSNALTSLLIAGFKSGPLSDSLLVSDDDSLIITSVRNRE